ncbi:hypothetical protein CARUB_v10022445mg, partial [Capsella rubella]
MGQKFHAFMFLWFAFGHMTPYLHLANKLAEKGHKITFLLPKKTQKQLEHLNLFPESIIFHPLTIPDVDGLPPLPENSFKPTVISVCNPSETVFSDGLFTETSVGSRAS